MWLALSLSGIVEAACVVEEHHTQARLLGDHAGNRVARDERWRIYVNTGEVDCAVLRLPELDELRVRARVRFADETRRRLRADRVVRDAKGMALHAPELRFGDTLIVRIRGSAQGFQWEPGRYGPVDEATLDLRVADGVELWSTAGPGAVPGDGSLELTLTDLEAQQGPVLGLGPAPAPPAPAEPAVLTIEVREDGTATVNGQPARVPSTDGFLRPGAAAPPLPAPGVAADLRVLIDVNHGGDTAGAWQSAGAASPLAWRFACDSGPGRTQCLGELRHPAGALPPAALAERAAFEAALRAPIPVTPRAAP